MLRKLFQMPAFARALAYRARPKNSTPRVDACHLLQESAARLKHEHPDQREGGFGVIEIGADHPDAVFCQIEPAIVWGLIAHGHGNFRVRWVRTEALHHALPALSDEDCLPLPPPYDESPRDNVA
jgi:hypothetical protein